MKILKASAGSGKTYSLSHTYIDLLLGSKNADAYRHILAVTFTNKATDEMKRRILKDLKARSASDPDSGKALVRMLHDYSAFAVSTIDRFFQQTLKAFSREIGQFADYQIELDRQSLINESMDRILDSLTPDKTELLDWIKDSVRVSLEQGAKADIESSLYQIGSQLKSEEHRALCAELGIDDRLQYTKERLALLRTECDSIIKTVSSKLREYGFENEVGKPLDFSRKKLLLKKNPELKAYAEEVLQRYNTAVMIRGLIFSLGLAGEFYEAFDSLLKEKNLMCLDESNVILKDIINGSDAPFVYEKIGVRFENFLLDEFQDTSNIQWDNFLPLLKESESAGGFNLVVGDVKQSIYRFRDSDWQLLGCKIQQQFPGADVKSLNGNWRSAPVVVKFNSSFFTMAASRLGLSSLYSDVNQTPMLTGETGGVVRVSFCEDQSGKVLESISRARENGAEWQDIAILVRGRQSGSLIAGILMDNGIPVISDDSLSLSASSTVRKVVALLKASDNPQDSVSKYLAESMNVSFPDNYYSLVDFAESLLRSVRDKDPETFEAETLFVQAFMDDLHNWTRVNGNSLSGFLDHWEESDITIGSPESESAVRIITVHKAKGLEFPYVIFPYADKVELYRDPTTRWCRLDAKKYGLPEVFDGVYPVRLGKNSANTFFAEDFHEEQGRQLVDNLNIFYVALTRAVKGLHIISKLPTKTFKDSLSKGAPEYKRVSDVLYEYVNSMDDCTIGEMYDFSKMERTQSSEQPFEASYETISLAGRLAPSTDAEDYFAEDGEAGFSASRRFKGIVMHDILASVHVASDVDRAVDCAVMSGEITPDVREDVRRLLSERIAAHPEWFPESGEYRVLNERTVFRKDGAQRRPDRVIISSDGVRIVDFKFGEEKDDYVCQVQRYAGIYKSMGYKVLSGTVWYVESDKTVEI